MFDPNSWTCQRCVSKAFIPVMRAEWPGIDGNKCAAAAMISAKKRATQLSRFMLQLLQNPLLTSQQVEGDSDSRSSDLGHESLAIGIALEVRMLNSACLVLSETN